MDTSGRRRVEGQALSLKATYENETEGLQLDVEPCAVDSDVWLLRCTAEARAGMRGFTTRGVPRGTLLLVSSASGPGRKLFAFQP